jgi:hypothetical protein
MFIPSLQREVNYKPLTIEQYYKIAHQNILYPKLNLGFNIGFIETILINCTEQINLTSFDKNIIALQIYINELQEKNILLSIEHPQGRVINYNDYIFNIAIPTLNTDLEFSNYIIQNNITDINMLLMCEIAKYINEITFKDTIIQYPQAIEEKLNILKQIPPKTLVRCMEYIDGVKNTINDYYLLYTNNPDVKYSISVLMP